MQFEMQFYATARRGGFGFHFLLRGVGFPFLRTRINGTAFALLGTTWPGMHTHPIGIFDLWMWCQRGWVPGCECDFRIARIPNPSSKREVNNIQWSGASAQKLIPSWKKTQPSSISRQPTVDCVHWARPLFTLGQQSFGPGDYLGVGPLGHFHVFQMNFPVYLAN